MLLDVNIAASDPPTQLAAASEPANQSTQSGHFVFHVRVILPPFHGLTLFFCALGGMLMILAPAVVRVMLFLIVLHAAQTHNQSLSEEVARHSLLSLAVILDVVNVNVVRVASNEILRKLRSHGDGEANVVNDSGAWIGLGCNAEPLLGQHRGELEAADFIGDGEGVEVE
jgi:hypothetical protein